MRDRATYGEPARVTEPAEPGFPTLVHPGWRERFPWLVQGTTTRGRGEGLDFGFFAGGSPGHVVQDHWSRLMEATGMDRAVYARQVHGVDVRLHRHVDPGLGMAEPCDGHVTDASGVLLAVTTADCVPVFVVSPEKRAVAVLHAGWRGAAKGVLEEGFSVLTRGVGVHASELNVHLGPAICGECYEVGPEVFEALDRPVPEAATPIDLREVLAARAIGQGVQPSAVSVSAHCTRCTDSDLFSHRGGDAFRQVGYLGIRP